MTSSNLPASLTHTNTRELPSHIPNHKSEYVMQIPAQQISLNDTEVKCLEVAPKSMADFSGI